MGTNKMKEINKVLVEDAAEDVTLHLVLYRLDKLEEEQRRENKEIMKLLHSIQENQHHTDEKIVQHTTELTRVNARLTKLEEGKVDVDKFNESSKNTNKRLDNYKQITIGILISVGALLLTKMIEII